MAVVSGSFFVAVDGLMNGASVLPYRTDAVALAEWLTARARGRTAEQLRSAVGSPKAVEGTAAAAVALGFTDPTEGELTNRGERFALADADERRALLKEAVLAYGPYREMLRALAERGAPAETEVRWVEAWWSTRGHGSSESNRREGAAAFGRLVDFVSLGEYVPGRRGRPTRIRWAPGALAREGGDRPVVGRRGDRDRPDPAPDLFSTTPPPEPPRPQHPAVRLDDASGEAVVNTGADGTPRAAPRLRGGTPVNRITVPLSGATDARIEVPIRLPRAEKRRLLDLLELLISEE